MKLNQPTADNLQEFADIWDIEAIAGTPQGWLMANGIDPDDCGNIAECINPEFIESAEDALRFIQEDLIVGNEEMKVIREILKVLF